MASRAPLAAVFDLGGVVFHYRPERRLGAFSRLTGLPVSEVRRRLVDSGYSHGCDAGRLGREAAHREGARLLGTRISLARFQSTWISAFEPDPAVVDLVRRLKARLPVAMLSNNSVLVRTGLESRYPEVMEQFRPRLFSAEAGVLKPDPRLFRTLLALLDADPDRVLYVDDEPACVAAAAAIGMSAWHYQGVAALAEALRRRDLPV